MRNLLGVVALALSLWSSGSAEAFFHLCGEHHWHFRLCCPRVVFRFEWGCPPPCHPPHPVVAWYDEFPPLPAAHYAGTHGHPSAAGQSPPALPSPRPVQAQPSSPRGSLWHAPGGWTPAAPTASAWPAYWYGR